MLDSHTIVPQLVVDFDRLPSMHGAVACPADDGSQILARLAYRRGCQVSISVGRTGCALVTNGSVYRTAAGFGSPRAFGPQLLASLTRLVNLDRDKSNAGSATALAHGRWSVLARSPLGMRFGAAFLWDGHELLELGGSDGGRRGAAPRDISAAYDPATHRWRRLASAPSAILPAGAAWKWTGHEVFVFGARHSPPRPLRVSPGFMTPPRTIGP